MSAMLQSAGAELGIACDRTIVIDAKGRMMVWGMLMPSGLGEFWPIGAFEGRIEPSSSGWRGRLECYYREKGLAEQQLLFVGGDNSDSYPSYVSGKFRSEIGSSYGPYNPPYNAIKLHEPPTFFETERRYGKLASIIALSDRLMAVDACIMALIERFEPGVHQFFPIEIRMPRGVVFPESYYVLVVNRYYNSFSPEASDVGSWRENGGPGYYAINRTAKGIRGLAFAKAAYGNSHLWRDRNMVGTLTFLSDELRSAIADAELRIPKHYRVKEV